MHHALRMDEAEVTTDPSRIDVVVVPAHPERYMEISNPGIDRKSKR